MTWTGRQTEGMSDQTNNDVCANELPLFMDEELSLALESAEKKFEPIMLHMKHSKVNCII